MIYEIVPYGDPELRVKCRPIVPGEPNLDEIIRNMFDTMYNAHGVGLAAPQVGVDIRLFITDGKPMEGASEYDDQPMDDFRKVFINPEILEESGENWPFNEGCLSIPGVREDVWRKFTLRLRYLDEHFQTHEETFSGIKARIIQHETDHLNGILFTDRLSTLRKQLVKSRLARIQKGLVVPDYPLRHAE